MSIPQPQERRLGYLLKLAQQALRRSMEDELRPLGLTLPQYAVMTHIAEAPDQSNAELARRAFITPQSMQGVLSKLEAAGLVRRAVAAEGRRQPTRLTSAGEALLARTVDIDMAVERRMRAAVAPLAPEAAAALLERIRDAFADGLPADDAQAEPTEIHQ